MAKKKAVVKVEEWTDKLSEEQKDHLHSVGVHRLDMFKSLRECQRVLEEEAINNKVDFDPCNECAEIAKILGV